MTIEQNRGLEEGTASSIAVICARWREASRTVVRFTLLFGVGFSPTKNGQDKFN